MGDFLLNAREKCVFPFMYDDTRDSLLRHMPYYSSAIVYSEILLYYVIFYN